MTPKKKAPAKKKAPKKKPLLLPGSELISLRQADREFGVIKRLGLRARAGEKVAVVRGDLDVAEIPLDFRDLDRLLGRKRYDSALSGLVIDGDLRVAGAITNYEMDFGPFLLVTGDLKAQSMGCGGSTVLVCGRLSLEHGLFGFYNHGSIEIEGPATVPVVLAEEHLIRFRGALRADVVQMANFIELDRAAKHNIGQEGGPLDKLRPELFDWTKWRAMDKEYRQGITSEGLAFDFITPLRSAILRWIEGGEPWLRGSHPWEMPPEQEPPAPKYHANCYYLDGVSQRADLAGFCVVHEPAWRELDFGRLYSTNFEVWGQQSVGAAPISVAYLLKEPFAWWVLCADGVVEGVSKQGGVAQWDVKAPVPLRRIREIGGRLFVCGALRHVYRLEGTRFRFLSEAIVAEGAGFEDMDGRAADDLYAVGRGGDVYHFDGRSWTALPSPTKGDLFALCVTDEGVAVVGASGSLLRWDGARWHASKTGKEDPLVGVAQHGGTLFAASRRQIYRLQGKKLVAERTGLEPAIGGGRLHSKAGMMWCIGYTALALYDGTGWRQQGCPDQQLYFGGEKVDTIPSEAIDLGLE